MDREHYDDMIHNLLQQMEESEYASKTFKTPQWDAQKACFVWRGTDKSGAE